MRQSGITNQISTRKKIRFTTYTLIYPFGAWVSVQGLERHWERADVTAEIVNGGTIKATTRNVSAIRFDVQFEKLILDGEELPGRQLQDYARIGQHWQVDPVGFNKGVRKKPLFCGPIDHAFMQPFIFVKPTGKPLNEKVDAWAKGELDHATEFWRRVFRGDAPVKDDTAITDDDIKKSNLVVWGDSSSNALLTRIMCHATRSQAELGNALAGEAELREQVRAQVQLGHEVSGLPLKWDAKTLEFNGLKYDAEHHVPVLIFPNPLNPRRYIVLNSGPTFREEALLNNSDQTPKLPDWAIVNIDTPPDGKWPGQIIDAGFFDEQWKLPK